jgi:transcriptional regulator with XRE-family HTH domain
MNSKINVFDGPALKKLREAEVDPSTGRPWSQAVLAFRMRDEGTPVTAQQIAKWEKDVGDPGRAQPQGRFLIALGRVFGKPVESFFRLHDRSK